MSLLYVCFYAGRVPRDLSQQNTRATRAGVLAQVSAVQVSAASATVTLNVGGLTADNAAVTVYGYGKGTRASALPLHTVGATLRRWTPPRSCAPTSTPVEPTLRPSMPAVPSGGSSLCGLSS